MLSLHSLQNEQFQMVMLWETCGVSSHRSSFDEVCGRSGLCVRFFPHSLWLSAASRVLCSSPQPPARPDKWCHLGKSDAGIKLMNDTLHINSLQSREPQTRAMCCRTHLSLSFPLSLLHVLPLPGCRFIVLSQHSNVFQHCFQHDLADFPWWLKSVHHLCYISGHFYHQGRKYYQEEDNDPNP